MQMLNTVQSLKKSIEKAKIKDSIQKMKRK